jgi:hypothetical protein
VKFAERLDAVGIPASLLVTYDPTRFAHSVPPNVERYVNLYQSSNILGGGGDVVQGRGFHGHYARACSVAIESGGILEKRRMGDSIGIDSL